MKTMLVAAAGAALLFTAPANAMMPGAAVPTVQAADSAITTVSTRVSRSVSSRSVASSSACALCTGLGLGLGNLLGVDLGISLLSTQSYSSQSFKAVTNSGGKGHRGGRR